MWTMATGILLSLFCCVWMVSSENEPSFLKSRTQVMAVKGTRAVLPCRISDVGDYSVVWSVQALLLTFQDRRIVDDTRLSIERPYVTDWNLHIRNVKLEDAGTYTCQISTNPVMAHHVKLLVLNEQPAPILPDEVLALAGSQVQIKCKLPDIYDIGTWSYKATERDDSVIIARNDKFNLRSGEGKESHVHTLTINDVRAGDAGMYFCRAISGAQSSTTLRVVVPPQPPSLRVNAESPNSLLVNWQKPAPGEGQVVGYVLYVTDSTTGQELVFEMGPGQNKRGQESFRVSDLTTNNTYMVQLASKYQLGSDITLGKRSPDVNITTPFFMPGAPGWVKVKRKSDDQAMVLWSPPDSRNSGIIRGYTITYTPLAKNKKPIRSKQKTVQVLNEGQTRWNVLLEGLRTKTRYHVQVRGFTREGDGRASRLVVYLHKRMPPELSLNGRVLSDNSVLLTVTTMGKGKMSNVKMFYTEAAELSWKSLDYSAEWKFTVVGGLDPTTSYFFMVKAKIGRRLKKSVTHITTPPHELLAPEGVSVSATASTSIEVKWDYSVGNSSSPLPLGYIVHLEETSEQGDEGKHHSQQVVFNKTSVEVKDLIPGMRYTIQVVAFNGFGEGPRTEGILFHIAETDVKQDIVNEKHPPRFTHDLPERIQVKPGEVVKIACVADGYPMPSVTWYVDGESVGEPAEGSNELYLDKVLKSTVLTCRAVSDLGAIERATHVDVIGEKEPDALSQRKNIVALGLIPSQIRSTTFSVGWEAILGDARNIERFDIVISDNQDRELLTRTLPRGTNTFNLRSLQPGTEYRVTLRAYGAKGLLTEAKTSVVTLTSDRDAALTTAAAAPPRTTTPAVTPSSPEQTAFRIPLTVTEVTPTSAILEWDLVGRDTHSVRLLEVKVMSKSNLTLLSKPLRVNQKVIDLNLQPGQEYYVQIQASRRRGGAVLASNTTKVTTPSLEDWRTTRAPRNEEEGPVLKRASLTLAPQDITGESARLDWSLAGAQQEDVGQFLVKIKDINDKTLLVKDMGREARSLTLSNLTPNTRYFVELLAVDGRGATIASTTTMLTTTELNEDADSVPRQLRVYIDKVDRSMVKIAWSTPHKLIPDIREVVVVLKDIGNNTLLTQRMTALTGSLTVRNMTSGEKFTASVELVGRRGQTMLSGYVEFETAPTPGMPGRPRITGAQRTDSTVRLEWVNTRSPSPAPGSDKILGHFINFARVDANNQPVEGTFQMPMFGDTTFAVIPTLYSGQRYKFQVSARNRYSFGPLSEPKYVDLL